MVDVTVGGTPIDVTSSATGASVSVASSTAAVSVDGDPILIQLAATGPTGPTGPAGGGGSGGKFTHHIELGSTLQANAPFWNDPGSAFFSGNFGTSSGDPWGPLIIGLHMFVICVGATGDAVGRTVRFNNFQISGQGFLAASSGGTPIATFSAGDGTFNVAPATYTFTGDEAYSAAGAVTMFDRVLTFTTPSNLYGQSILGYSFGKALMIDDLSGGVTVDPIGDYAAPSSVTFLTGVGTVITKMGETGSELINDSAGLDPITDWTDASVAGTFGSSFWDFLISGNPNSYLAPIRWEVE